MQVQLTDFEARVVRAALTDYALTLEPCANGVDPNGRRMPIEMSAFLITGVANDLNERLKQAIGEAANKPKGNYFQEA